MNTLRWRATASGLLFSLVLSLVVAERATSQESTSEGNPKLPEASKLLERYVEVTGGKEAYEKVKSRITEATLELSAMQMKFPMTIYQNDKMFIRTDMDLGAMGGGQSQGLTNGVGWEISPMTGVRVLTGDELESLQRNAHLHPELEWRKMYSSAKTVGEETVNGKATYKVELMPKGKNPTPTYQYFDQESGLLVRTVSTEPGQNGGKMKLTSDLTEWKEHDGIKFPAKTKVMMETQELVLSVGKIRHNVEIPADKLEVPSQIQELLERQKKAAEEKAKEEAEKKGGEATTQPSSGG